MTVLLLTLLSQLPDPPPASVKPAGPSLTMTFVLTYREDDNYPNRVVRQALTADRAEIVALNPDWPGIDEYAEEVLRLREALIPYSVTDLVEEGLPSHTNTPGYVMSRYDHEIRYFRPETFLLHTHFLKHAAYLKALHEYDLNTIGAAKAVNRWLPTRTHECTFYEEYTGFDIVLHKQEYAVEPFPPTGLQLFWSRNISVYVDGNWRDDPFLAARQEGDDVVEILKRMDMGTGLLEECIRYQEENQRVKLSNERDRWINQMNLLR